MSQYERHETGDIQWTGHMSEEGKKEGKRKGIYRVC